MEGINFDVGLNTGGFSSGIGGMMNSLNSLAGTAKTVGGIIATALGGAAVIGAITDATKAFHDYEEGIAEITTLTGGDASQAMVKYGNTVKDVMRTSGSDFETAKKATYDFISTFGEIEDMNKMMMLSSKQAVAGVTDPATAVKFLGSVIKGFGVPATEEMAKTVFDLGQQTVKLGRTTFPELSAKVGAAIPMASALNISMTEFFANLGASTQIMNTTSQAADGMKAALSNMTKPTEQMQVAMGNYAESLGLSRDANAQAIIEAVGFTDALQGIAAQAEGNTSLLTEMFGSIEGVNWVLSVTGENAKNVDYILGEMSESAGTTEEAYEKMADTASFAFKQLKTETDLLKISFGELFSTIALPFAKNLTVTLQDWAFSVKGFKEDFVAWRDELQSKDTFGEKLEFTLDALINIGQMILQAAGEKIDDFADYIRTDILGMEADKNETVDLEDIQVIVEGVLEVADTLIDWAEGALVKVSKAVAAKYPDIQPPTDDKFGIDDVSVFVYGLMKLGGTAIEWAQGVIHTVAVKVSERYPDIQPPTQDTFTVNDITVIIKGVLKAGQTLFEWAAGAANAVSNAIAAKLPEVEPDPSKEFTLNDIKIIGTGVWQGFKNMAEIAGDIQTELDTWISEQTGSEAVGAVAGSIPLMIPVMFGISQAQKGLDHMMLNSATFGKGLMKLGGELGLAYGISVAITGIEPGEIKETAFKQAIAASLGVAAGLLTGNPAVGGLVYGVTVAIEEIALKKDPDDYFRDLQDKTLSFDDLFTSDPSASNMRDRAVDFWREFKTNLKQVTAGDWEQVLTPEQKDVVKQAQDFSILLGEELKKGYNEIDWGSILEAYQDIDKIKMQLEADSDTKLSDMANLVVTLDTGEATAKMEAWIATYKDLYGTYTYDQQIGKELTEEQKNPSGTITYEPVQSSALGDFVSGIFEGAQAKIDNIKNAISGMFEDADIEKNSIDTEIDHLQEKIEAASKDADRLDNIGEQARKNIETLEGKITALESKSHLVDIGVNIAEGAYVALGNFGLLLDGVKGVFTSVVNAVVNGKDDVDEAKKSLESVPTDPILPQVNAEVNGIDKIWNVQDALELIPPVTPSEITAIDNASGTIKVIQEMTIEDKFFNIIGLRKEEAGSGSGGGGGGSFNDDDFTPHNGAFDLGGYTANVGRNTPAGIVHGGEWVAPAWMVEDSKFSRAIESLEQARTNRGYASGGTVMPQQNLQPVINFTFHVDQFVGTEEEAGNRIGEIAYTKLKEQGYV